MEQGLKSGGMTGLIGCATLGQSLNSLILYSHLGNNMQGVQKLFSLNNLTNSLLDPCGKANGQKSEIYHSTLTRATLILDDLKGVMHDL